MPKSPQTWIIPTLTPSLHPGIRKAVETADALVVIVSEKGVSDSNVGLEIGMATGLGKKVVAVVAPDAEPDLALLRSIADAYILDAARHKQNEVGAELRKALQGEQITDRHTSA